MSAKPYSDDEIAAIRANPFDKERIWLATVDTLKARLASAEAEVARLKALLEPKRPYEPKVGDVVTFWNGSVGIIKRRCKDGRGWRIENKAREEWWEVWLDSDLRPATPAERAVAGLPPEPAITAPSGTVAKMYDDILDDYGEWLRAAVAAKAPAKPEVLPEHLAFVERMARFGDTDEARALLSAIARRDGGPK